MRRILLPLASFAMLFAANASTARGLVMIVNPESGVDALSRDDAVNIFMGRYRKLPSGIAALPIDIGGSNPRRKQFYALLLNRDLAEIDAYWARLVFSGQTSPPQQVADDKTAVRLVAGNRNAIAYVDGDAVDGRVKVVLELEPR